ncbi:sensor histidine kinase [Paenibacillus piscarius]|uniref:sensor histidine kinase n=1 Tax=Paenibacillus piscarius TaxID=1089681 RepID=UPI001EE8F55A|nr:HAMP domain-containing sensor histidine kinase [Paenibacillus piscarius]
MTDRFRFLRSLRRQLLAASLLILSGLLILIGILQYVLMRNVIYSNRAEVMEAQLRSLPIEFLLNNPGWPGGGRHQGGDRWPLLLDARTTIAIYSPAGSFRDLQEETLSTAAAPRMSDSEYKRLLMLPPRKLSGTYQLMPAGDGSEHIVVFMNYGRPGDTRMLLQMSTETGPLREIILRQLLVFGGLSAAALLAGLFLYLPALRRTLIPLSNMGKTAQVIDAGNLNVRFPDGQGQLEIDRLARSFNGMLERLEHSFEAEREAKEQMRRFAADASHELRTPLTSIYGFLEVLLRGAADNREQLYSALQSMHGEAKRINQLVEDLLLLARMDSAPQMQTRELLLDGLIRDMQPQLQVLAGSRTVLTDISSGIRCHADPDRIRQVLLNLFHNAVQHTDAGTGIIQISLHARGETAELAVKDNGPGIAAGHLPHIFERFYRSDASRTRKYGGSGLGLSIAKSIAQAHGGAVTVSSTLGEGSVFTLTLPRLPDSLRGGS